MNFHRMRGIPVTLTAVAALLAAASGCSASARSQAKQQAGPHATGQAVQSVLQYLSEMARRGNFSGTVLVAKRGRVVIRVAFGIADAANYEPNQPRQASTRVHSRSPVRPSPCL
jgi:CubicO group peptidase (beta-lactamase class C family)